MSDRYRVSTVKRWKDKRTGEEKSKFIAVGWGRKNDKGNITINLDVFPMDGYLIISKYDPDRRNYQDGRSRNDYQQDSGRGYREDEAPF